MYLSFVKYGAKVTRNNSFCVHKGNNINKLHASVSLFIPCISSQYHVMALRRWKLEVSFPPKGSSPSLIGCGERGGGPRQTVDGEGEELSWSQCSSSIDSLSWWKETFQCSCSPLSSSSMQMTSLLTSRCSPSTTPMSSRSSLKVSWLNKTVYLLCPYMLCCVYYIRTGDLDGHFFLPF